MKDIIKCLFNYKFKIIVVLFLLFIQAFLELSLPTYTSDIVNIGIGRNGIESNVPKSLSKESYETLKTYLTDKEIEILDKNYEIKEDKYELINNDEELSKILLYPEIIIVNDNIDKNITVNELKELYKGNETLIEQTSYNFVIEEYKKLNIDINEIQTSYIKKTGFKMVLISVLTLLITFVSIYISSNIMAYFGRDLKEKLVKKVMSFENEEISNFSVSSLITRCNNDVTQITMLAMVFFRIVIYAPIIGIGAIYKVHTLNLSYVIVLPVVLILLLMLLLFFIVVPKLRIFQDLLDKLNKVSREILTGLPVIRSFINEKKEEERFNKVNDEITKTSLFIGRSMAFLNPTLTLIMNSSTILIVWVSASKINEGIMGVGNMLALMTYIVEICLSFLMVSMVAMMLPRSIVSAKRIGEIFKTEVSIKDNANSKEINRINEIEFKNVYFKYPKSNGYTLKNINFKIKKGTTIGIIGSTGSGKSSIINLIPRFYDTTKGNVLINGTDIKGVKLKELRKLIGYVPQKPWLMPGTISSNINFGNKELNMDLIKSSAKISQIEEFINERETKYESEITEGSTNVSGGERQRLSIARALALNPEVLIFDDSMSALDFKTESKLRKELNALKKEKIIFLISTRINTVINADKIIVIDNGVIVGIGTHQELLKKCKIYKEIKKSLGGE